MKEFADSGDRCNRYTMSFTSADGRTSGKFVQKVMYYSYLTKQFAGSEES